MVTGAPQDQHLALCLCLPVILRLDIYVSLVYCIHVLQGRTVNNMILLVLPVPMGTGAMVRRQHALRNGARVDLLAFLEQYLTASPESTAFQDHQYVQIVQLEHFLLVMFSNVQAVRMVITHQLVLRLVHYVELVHLHLRVLRAAHHVQLEATVSLDLDTLVMRVNILTHRPLSAVDVQLVNIILLSPGILGPLPVFVKIVPQVIIAQLEL